MEVSQSIDCTTAFHTPTATCTSTIALSAKRRFISIRNAQLVCYGYIVCVVILGDWMLTDMFTDNREKRVKRLIGRRISLSVQQPER